MIAKFADIERALGYALESVCQAHEEDTFDVLAESHHHEVCETVEVPGDDVHALSARLCHRFPAATVCCNEGESGHRFAAVQCSCSPEVHHTCPNHCSHIADKPTLLVIAHRPGEALDVEHRLNILEQAQDELHADYQRERGQVDARENPNLPRDRHRQKRERRAFEEWRNR